MQIFSRPFVSVRSMNYSSKSQDFEFDPLQPTTVILPQAAIDWAVMICQQETDGVQQWPTFLRAMALKGVEHWLEAGTSDLPLHYDRNQIPGPGIQAEVNGFRLCLVIQSSLSDEQVFIPKATLDDPHHFAHLYVLVEVKEEADQVTILCGLRRDRLLAYQQQGLIANGNGTYRLPITCFDTRPEDILLYLTCLNPMQVVTAQEAASLSPTASAASPPLRNKRAINVGQWFQDQLDAVAHSLTWTLLPPLSLSHAMMSAHSPAEMLESVLGELEPMGVVIPTQARGAYTEFQPMGLPLRLYALTWPLFETPQPEWSLFLVLGPATGEQVPAGTRLVVRDATTMLADSTLTSDSQANHLYAQVFGTWDEQFTITLELPNGTVWNWPPFVFQPTEEQNKFEV